MIIRKGSRLAAYAICHFAVDALCCSLLYWIMPSPLFWILGYHGFAFALQPLIGCWTDRHPDWPGGRISIGLILLGYGLHGIPAAAVTAAGLGNALFHLEGGYVSLHGRTHVLRDAGLFVAPGALGIGLASALGSRGVFSVSLLAGLAAGTVFLLAMTPVEPSLKAERGTDCGLGSPEMIGLILLSVLLRGYGGMILPKTAGGLYGPLAMAIPAMAGKMAGGFLGERFGGRRVAIVAQLLSAALIGLTAYWPGFSLLCVFLTNLPMAITLAALSDALPDHTGAAFGLAPTMLFLGYMVSLLGYPAAPAWLYAGLMASSAAASAIGLRPLRR